MTEQEQVLQPHSIAYLQKLGIDVWLSKKRPQTERRPNRENRSSDSRGVRRRPESSPVVDQPHGSPLPEVREDVGDLPEPVGSESGSTPPHGPAVEFTLSWVQRGSVVGIAEIASSTERQLLLDMVDYLNDYRGDQHSAPFRSITWPPPGKFGSAPGQDRSKTRAVKFLSEHARVNYADAAIILVVGLQAGELTSQVRGDMCRIVLDAFPKNPESKVAVWKRLLDLRG